MPEKHEINMKTKRTQEVSSVDWNTKQGEYFNEFSDQHGIFNFDTESLISREMSYKFIDLMRLSAGSRLLEFGCGRGEWIIRLSKQGFNIDGFDISSKSINRLSDCIKGLGLEKHVNLYTADAQIEPNLLTGSSGYNTVFCYNLLHHVSSIERVVENMVNLTAKGGTVLAYEPNPWHFWWYLYPFLDRQFKWSVEQGLLKTNPIKLKNIFQENGLSHVEILPWDYFPFISPEKTLNATKILNHFLSKTPLLKYLPAVYVIRGYKL